MINYIQLRTGALFIYGHLNNEVSLDDLALHLGKISRFAGATVPFWSVAQHSVFADDIVCANGGRGKVRKRALLHDGHEMATNDIPTPLHRHITEKVSDYIFSRFGERVTYDVIDEIKAEIDHNIFIKHGLTPTYPEDEKKLIKFADTQAFITEATQLLDPVPNWLDQFDIPPYDVKLEPMTWEESADAFIKRYKEIDAEIECIRAADQEDRLQPVCEGA
jgi:5'-deoxynucleotidase YfbR-like HD superfamily hydrolase